MTFYTMIMMVALSITPMFANAPEPTTVSNTTKEMPTEVKVMLNRLEEIKEMDKSELTSSERKSLRKEVRGIKANLKASGNGVYLSIGAIIIIVLLLIILL